MKLFKLFLENGTSPAYVKDKEILSAFHIAAKEDNVLVMKELITACPDIYELLATGFECSSFCCRKWNVGSSPIFCGETRT